MATPTPTRSELRASTHAEESTARQRTALTIMKVGMALGVVGLAGSMVLAPRLGPVHLGYALAFAVHVPALCLIRQGRLRLGLTLFCVLYLGAVFALMASLGGVTIPVGFALPPIVLFMGLTWSGRAALITALTASLVSLLLLLAQRAGRLPPVNEFEPAQTWLLATIAVAITGWMLLVALQGMADSRGQAEANQQARERLEEHLARTRRLESVGRLAAGVAHDFNNLLTVILADAEAICAASEPCTGPVHDCAANILSAAERASVLTRQLLAFGRRQLVAPKPIDLDAALHDLQHLLGKLLGETVRLKFDLASSALRVLADRAEIEQVVINLCTNAGDAMPEGGRLAIKTWQASRDSLRGLPSAFDLGARADTPQLEARWVCLQVSDSGLGMDAATRARLFEPFFTTKEFGKGTGLGLATVHGIVTRMNGQILVESSPGQGSTFTLVLPGVLASEAGVEAATPARPRLPAQGTTVQVLEDDPQVREAVARMLRDGGYEVSVASSAVVLLTESHGWTKTPDLLLTDVIMPGLSGPEVARRLRQRFPELRTMFMSGYAEARLSARGILLDEVHFLAKPFDAAALLEKVAQVLAAPNVGALGEVDVAS